MDQGAIAKPRWQRADLSIAEVDETNRREPETMNPTNRRRGLRWTLIFFLAALGLARPLLSITGFYDAVGGDPWAPALVTILIAAVWVGVVVAARAPNPLVTLVLVGGLYGVFAILLQQVIWNLVLGSVPEGAPSSVPVMVMSWVSILVTNTVWGAFLGLLATGVCRLLPRRGTAA
jgi:hypothetical protein